MKINGKTKISEIIKANENAIEAIASINPHFKKLKNPVLRKVLAPRVTISDAAKVGKCDVQEIFNKLKSIGFEIENSVGNEKEREMTQKEVHPKITEAIAAQKIKTLDVRPILESGIDPFKAIMETVTTLPEGFAIELINTFEPVPLINILHKRGFVYSTEWRGDVIHVFFAKAEVAKETSAEVPYTKVTFEELQKLKKHFGQNIKEIDVRDLEMPEPMITILSSLENLSDNHALFVHHKKIPQYLLPELQSRNFQTWIAEISEGDVKMLVHK